MSEKTSKDQYGRKTWDVEAYAQESKTVKKEQAPISQDHIIKDSESASHLDHRQRLLAQSIGAVKTYNIINPLNANHGSYGKNKRFGFFCPVCNLSFRDNLSLIDHFNSPQHSNNAKKLNNDENDEGGEDIEGGIKHATIEQVVKMMEIEVAKLIKRKSATKQQELTFQQRVEKRKLFEEEKRRKRREKKRKSMVKSHENLDDNSSQLDLQQQLGFSGFGTTKKPH